MKNTIFLIIAFVFVGFNNAICQQIFFNKQIAFPSASSFALSILQKDTNYCAIANIGNPNGSMIAFINMDINGEIVSKKFYQDSLWEYYCSGVGQLVKIEDGFILGATKHKLFTDTALAVLMKLDNDGDTIWTKLYKDVYFGLNNLYITQVKPTIDKGYVLTGRIRTATNNYSFLLIKTDSLGNELWRRYYGYGGYYVYNISINIHCTDDGGYIMGGETTYQWQTKGQNILIIKVDSLGNQQWIKNLGGNFNDVGGTITISKDSNYLVLMALNIDSTQSSAVLSKINVIKISKSGNLIWSKGFGPYKIDNIPYMIRSLANGGYVVVGSSYNSAVNTLERFAWIMRFDENGDSIWYKQYRNYWEDRYIPHYLVDVNQTSDNGFVACGKIEDWLGTFNDMWVIKFDSNGCINSGCTTGIEVEDEAFASKQFTIFPNPATNEIHLEFDKSMQSEEKQVFIFDATGRLIKQLRFDKNETEPSISVQDLDQGIYFIKVIVNNKEEMSDKFLKL
jgi:hypothetical protein